MDGNKETNFNPCYTFETFEVCNANELAVAVAAQSTGEEYNPFFLYGKHGSGKTHLLHAIGNGTLKQHSSAKILYLTGQEFVSDAASKSKKNEKELYKEYDVLMVDGIRVMAGKEATQKLLLNIIDVFVASKKQVIITSELAPKCFSVIDTYDRGIIADIDCPQRNTKPV